MTKHPIPALAVAIYLAASANCPGEELAKAKLDKQAKPAEIDFTQSDPLAKLPQEKVVYTLSDGLPDDSFELPKNSGKPEVHSQNAFAWIAIPKKYDGHGLIGERKDTVLLRAGFAREFPEGDYKFLLRSFNAARLYVDGKLIAETKFIRKATNGHESVPPQPERIRDDLVTLAPHHQQQVVDLPLDAGLHEFHIEAVAGGQKRRQELGHLYVGIAKGDEPFALLAPANSPEVSLNAAGWHRHTESLREELRQVESAARRDASAQEDKRWEARHRKAAELAGDQPAIPKVKTASGNPIDAFIAAKLQQQRIEPAPLVSDGDFLRRASLDTVGVPPSLKEIEAFRAEAKSKRRAKTIDRLLDDPRWADHWIGYWQDVLAENPGILKPTLNNTGPFRWWIYESFLDNKPIDRFVTELILMQGSRLGGGPAGFGMATQNDVPMAAKAHIVGTAFLGVQMKCARCHDAPMHDHTQRDLFSMAAMLEQQAIKLPASSTVPVQEGGRIPLVEITLRPGEKITPAWPFPHLAKPAMLSKGQKDSSPREKLAAIVTAVENERFARVVVNRLWARYLGTGIVEPVDDWFDREPSHPELLDYLAHELVTSGYDLKHVARLILNSHAYQRQIAANSQHDAQHFASPIRRRMTAEQVLDSMFAVCGKQPGGELLTMDPAGRYDSNKQQNLGAPRRAWQLTSLSNERDRPALALPVAQSLVDVLLAYGWRQSRQSPITERDQHATPLTPLTLANGIVGMRATRLSDEHTVTALCHRKLKLEELIDCVFLQYLSRSPTDEETAMFAKLLKPGYEERITAPLDVESIAPWRPSPHMVSWSNHLNSKATEIMLAAEAEVERGAPPTETLAADWRERMEDMLWSLVNSPEFVFVP